MPGNNEQNDLNPLRPNGGYLDFREYSNSGIFNKDNIYFMPILHGSFEFGICAGLLVRELKPDCIALELPPQMKAPYLKAVERLPFISAVCVESKSVLTYHLVEPQDAMSEAVRSFGTENKENIHLIDYFCDGYKEHSDKFPDSYAINVVGYVNYCLKYFDTQKNLGITERENEDIVREQYMAAILQELSRKYKKILFVCGLYHYPAIFKMLDYNNAIPLVRNNIEKAYLTNLSEESHKSVLSEYAYMIKHFELQKKAALAELNADTAHDQIKSQNGGIDNELKDKFAECGSRVQTERNDNPEESGENKKDAKSNIINFLNFLNKFNSGKNEHNTAVTSENEAEYYNQTNMKDMESDKAFGRAPNQANHNFMKAENNSISLKNDKIFDNKLEDLEMQYSFASITELDREKINFKLIKAAAIMYLKNTGSEIPRTAFPVLFKFLKNYLRLKGCLSATIYDLIIGARAIADDNFAYEVFDMATNYPWLDRTNSYATLNITLEDLKIDGKKITFHRRLKSMRQMFEPFLKRRKKEGSPGEWLKEWNENQDSMCSYQPEDIAIENFGNFLRRKAKAILTDEQCRIEPFTTSLMDGVDMRETIKNYHINKKLYVKIGRFAAGKVGSVVFIFDDDLPGGSSGAEKYPWKMTWLGEHHQESDMAFYSTKPGEKVVGPGISRCEYGGFMLSFPPLRLYDVWSDPYYFAAKTKPEKLLMAAIDYSLEKYIVYCAKKPPRSFFKNIAAKLGKKIVFVPMGQLSPGTIKKLQVMHILSDKNKRAVAKDYIW